jgi:hypothetical protein
VVASNHKRRFDNALSDQFIELKSSFIAFAITQPADACGQTLELDLLSGHSYPAMQRLILREELKNSLIGAIDIFWVARECHPTEGAFAATEEGTNKSRYKAGKVHGMSLASRQGLSPQIVAIIEDNGSSLLHLQHGTHMDHH